MPSIGRSGSTASASTAKRSESARGKEASNSKCSKKTALDALRAPIALDAGYIGSLRLKVPWTNLGEEAVVVEIDRVFLLENLE